MAPQRALFGDLEDKGKKQYAVGNGLVLEVKENYPPSAFLYQQGVLIKKVNLADKSAKKLFIVEALDHGAMKSRLATALQMSRQTIDNYQGTMKYFGLEGLIQGYSVSDSKSRQIQRKNHAASDKRIGGNRAKQLAEIRRQARENRAKQNRELPISFGYAPRSLAVEPKEQVFAEEHDWQPTRYAGVFTYLIALISQWQWLQLVMGYFGSAYRIFLVFLLMGARDIRSLEQMKNVRLGEAGRVLGLTRLPSKPRLWQWFYSACERGLSLSLRADYFRYQLRAGLVSLYLWFIDGHLLPYTGKAAMHYAYNTQRRMPEPGRTNLVTCDSAGRIIDFEIQEGKGDLKGYIVSLWHKWRADLPASAMMVFDREGYDAGFFSRLVLAGIAFATWQKNVDGKQLAAIEDEKFSEAFEFNNKPYGVFEKEKIVTYYPAEDLAMGAHCFKLRHIFIWNQSSNRRACGVAWSGNLEMSTVECARAILSRWGASENTFKHTKKRHPLHYHPGFKLVDSDNQEIKNPMLKETEQQIKRLKKQIDNLYKKLAHSKRALKKDGTTRQNSVKQRLKKDIQQKEEQLKGLKEEKRQMPERVNVSTLQDYKSIKQIDNEGKYLFDFVTSSVWNARKLMVNWLQSYYRQQNEVVDLFYAITNCQGWIKSTTKEVIVRLEPMQQLDRRMAQEELCRKLTTLGAQTPNGKWLKIEVGKSPLH